MINREKTSTANEEYMTTQEVADFLRRSTASIYKYVKDEKLTPVYDHKWRMRKTKLFKRSEVEAFKNQISKPGLSTFEVIKLSKVAENPVELSYPTLMWFISEGVLPTFKAIYREQEQYFITQGDFDRFMKSDFLLEYRNRKEKNYISTDHGDLFLFQSLLHPETGTLARIMEIDKSEVKVLTQQEETLSLNEALQTGYQTRYHYDDLPFSTKKGYAKFQFIKPYPVRATIYSIIENFYRQAGPKNLKIKTNQEYIRLEIKPTLIKGLSNDEIRQLEQYLIEGKLIDEIEGVFIDTDLEALTIHIPSSMKKYIREEATAQEVSMEEFTFQALKSLWKIED